MAYSGNRALTLDAMYVLPSNNINYLEGTYNLSFYNANMNDLRLDFRFTHHGQENDPQNRVWIRGNDGHPWLEVFNLDLAGGEPGDYVHTRSIELSDLLFAAGQNFGTSFQVRWGQSGRNPTTEPEHGAGLSFDDIRLYEVFNDVQLSAIEEPLAASCGLTTGNPVVISVFNSSNTTLLNIPVRYRINNGSWVIENIPSITPNTSISYSFTNVADLSALGTHLVEAVVDYPGDSFRENDTLRVAVVNSPVITSFPYLQNFEGGSAYWYASGRNNSWEYGTPASNRISGAASGARAWKTRLTGNYNDKEHSYLYSPCFDISGMTNPHLSFSVAMDIEDCGAFLCDGAWVEYSSDGVNWTKLGAHGQGTNWYNKTGFNLWSRQDKSRWHVATIPLPVVGSKLRIRIVMQSDMAANREGLAIDDIHIYDNTHGIYDGITMASPVTQAATGTGWVDYLSGGKLVASIRPDGQNLGTTEVQAFIIYTAR
jgi:hypothetical protein